jgi:hypothetical protein
MINPNHPPDSTPCGLNPDPTCRVKSETPQAAALWVACISGGARPVAVEWRSVGLVGVGGFGQAAGRYSLMSPAQVVCRWIGRPGPITATGGCSVVHWVLDG